MTIDEAEKIKMVVENKNYIAELVNAVGKTMVEAFENLKIKDVNMFQLGYNNGIDDFITKISESNKGHWRPTQYEHGEVVSETMSYDIGTIKEIAEQLKAGKSNGS